MKIHAKLVGFVVVALLIPLFLGIFYIHYFGQFYYQKQKGVLYLTIAEELADTLQDGVQRNFQKVSNWIHFGAIPHLIEAVPVPPVNMEEILRMESSWADLSTNDAPLHAILSCPLSVQLRVFQLINPVFAEILVTDRFGRLIGATNPTTDYWQSDEFWWESAAALSREEGLVHGVVYDESADVLAIDMAFPVFSTDAPHEFLGALKVSLHATHLLQLAAPDPWNKEILRDIFFPDGRLLIRLDGGAEPGLSHIPAPVFQALLETTGKWVTVELEPGTPALAAVVRIPIVHGLFISPEGPARTRELYVVVHRDLEATMRPVREMLWQLTFYGVVTALIFALLSYLMTQCWFARPLAKLRAATLSIVKHIQQSEQGRYEDAWDSRLAAKEKLTALEAIHTRDELQDLSADFVRMGGRMLDFHRQLEQELTEKTEEIHSDLVMAREFQEALLPQDYPDLVMSCGARLYNLHFSHIYHPALSVSGDFFDIAKVSNYCVRVFIADVMGHGARSALMTAILHTLLHSVKKSPENPAELLQRMNEEFFAIGRKTDETIFVTAVHLVIDTATGVIRYASAGHPPPLSIDHADGAIKLLQPPGRQPPAIGLFRETVYENHEVPIAGDQTVLLYTDGATDAMNSKNEEFGSARLIETVRSAYQDSALTTLPEYILENLNDFMDTVPAVDDICLISANLTRAQNGSAA